MTINFLNCFTCGAYVPRGLQTGELCLLVETAQGLVLVDPGLGQDDIIHKSGILRVFEVVTIVPLNPAEAAVRQVARLGYNPEDVRHIVLTHVHFDHCGGILDFPHATVHVHRREHAAFTGAPRTWSDAAYVRRHIAHDPEFVLYEDTGDDWKGLDAIRLPFDPEMWLVPLFGHTRGHCGVVIKSEAGWLFHAGDAESGAIGEDVPRWVCRLVLGPHVPRLRQFAAAHPEVRMTAGHMDLDFFNDMAAGQ